MSTYRDPLRDMQFVLRELAGLDEIAKLSRLRLDRRLLVVA
jgi:hypothetical protein